MAIGDRFRYRRQITQHGEAVLLRRYTGTGPTRVANDVSIRGWVKGFEPHTLIGGITYGDRHAIILAEDVTARGFVLPITTSDKLVVRGRELAITVIDDSTHRDKTLLIAFELKVSG